MALHVSGSSFDISQVLDSSQVFLCKLIVFKQICQTLLRFPWGQGVSTGIYLEFSS